MGRGAGGGYVPSAGIFVMVQGRCDEHHAHKRAGRHLYRAVLVALLDCLPGCAERVTGVPPMQSTGRPPQPLSAGATADPAAASAPGGAPGRAPAPRTEAWAEAVRAERWAEAAPCSTRCRRPPGAAGDPLRAGARRDRAEGRRRAVSLLAGLEAALPALARDVARWRAEAAAEAGPFAEAAAYFARGSKRARFCARRRRSTRAATPPGRCAMAEWRDRGAEGEARARRGRGARALRARLYEAGGKTVSAVTDFRWLATKAAARRKGLPPPRRWRASNRRSPPRSGWPAIGEMIQRGAATEALAEVERIEGKAGFAALEVKHARAMALYKARSWAEAAKAFQEAAAAKSGREAEQLYYAARAARAATRTTRPSSSTATWPRVTRRRFWSERASYLAARLLMLNGRFKEAAEAYKRYLATYPKGEGRDDAEYERALSLLSSDGPKRRAPPSGSSRAAPSPSRLPSARARGRGRLARRRPRRRRWRSGPRSRARARSPGPRRPPAPASRSRARRRRR